MSINLYAPRPLFEEEHLAFRDMVRDFLDHYVDGHVEEWERTGEIPAEVIKAAGEMGMFGLSAPEEFGGGGTDDYRFRMAAIEEFAKYGATSLAATIATHGDIVVPYITHLATDEQKARWMPKIASGEWIAAIAMTEPGAGSDLRGMKTTAVKQGDEWVLNGSKTFITNGINSGLVVVAARTPDESHPKGGGITLFAVESGTPGFSRGRRLEKLGMHAQDTAELFFEDVRLTDADVLGDLHTGLHALMGHLPLERLSIAVAACAGARAALNWTIDYVQERHAFGKAIAEFQNTEFVLAELVTQLEVMQAYVDQSVLSLNKGELTAVDAAKAKWWTTEAHKQIVDRCLQLFGGYGYMLEYPIARAYADTRVTTIYGGTTEIMKMLIARDILGGKK